MSRIVPSPDWFVGVDSLDLCTDGRWRDAVVVDAEPLDAGTNRGLTFTAPRWEAKPAANISRITSRSPAHPASSFYYPKLERLPRMGTFLFHKLREYALVSESATATSNDVLGYRTRYLQGDDEVIAAATTANTLPGPAARVVPCLVSEWSSWSSCSQTCGIGESRRQRRVLQHARGGGRPCPPLSELRWCGSARHCANTYFRW